MSTPSTAIIGLGCIGGSLARALAESGAAVEGWSSSADDRAAASAAGIPVRGTSIEDAVRRAELVVLAVPVQAVRAVAEQVLRATPASAVILHCGGVQSRDALALEDAVYARVLGTHPLAGSQDSGFAASRAELFRGCAVSIEARATSAQEESARSLWQLVGAARIDRRTAEEHDQLVAWISQLPQLASTALAAAFASARINPASVGPGARDSTRLAASAYEQWASLLQAQPVVLDGALAQLERSIASIRDALRHSDQRALRAIWDDAREWRRAVETSR